MSKKKHSRASTLYPTKPFPPQSIKFEWVLKGDKIALPVVEKDGSRTGYARVAAPDCGWLVTIGNECAFISDNDLSHEAGCPF